MKNLTNEELKNTKEFHCDLGVEQLSAIADLNSKIINDQEYRNELKFCPICNARIEDRKVSIYQELIQDLYKVYVWLGKNKTHTFDMKEIREKISKNNYARFGDLVRLGGLVYKFKDDNGNKMRGKYGLNMKRCKEFFKGERTIPVQITLNQITNEIIDAKYVAVSEIPGLKEYINIDGLYDYEKSI